MAWGMWHRQVAKGTAPPVLPPLLPKGLSSPAANRRAKTSLEVNVLRGTGLAKETDPAPFLQPSRSPEEGKIPFNSSAERNSASAMMDRDPGDPSAAASLSAGAGAGRVLRAPSACPLHHQLAGLEHMNRLVQTEKHFLQRFGRQQKL